MATTNPNLIVSLTGDTFVTKLDKEKSWSGGTKLEQNYSIRDTDGSQVIDISDLENITMMIFESSSAFTVSITAGGSTLAIPVDNIFLFDPTATFVATITNISISTTLTTDITIQVRIYGSTT